MGQHHPDSISQHLVEDPKGLQGQLGNVDFQCAWAQMMMLNMLLVGIRHTS